MKRSALLATSLGALLVVPSCHDEVSGFLSCGIELCNGNQSCISDGGDPYCSCREGYTGDACDSCATGFERSRGGQCDPIIIDCSDAEPCGLHGACIASRDGDRCECDETYVGFLCESCEAGFQDNDGDTFCSPTCERSGLDCAAPSRCVDASGAAVCECEEGHTGEDCSFCALGYRDNGTRCVATCEAHPPSCAPDQACEDTDDGPRCACPPGYTGASCTDCDADHRKDDATGLCLPSCAASDRCGPHARCDDRSGFATCRCDAGYAGEDCDDCSAGFAVTPEGLCEFSPSAEDTVLAVVEMEGAPALATVNPLTGDAILVSGRRATGLAESDPGVVFTHDGSGILEVTLATDEATLAVGAPGASGPIAWDRALGRLYALSPDPPFALLAIDPALNIVEELFPTNLAGVVDLALDTAGHRVLALRDDLYAIALGDGSVSRLGSLPPASVGIALDEGELLALAATDAPDNRAAIAACRATAVALGAAGHAAATGRYLGPASDQTSVSVGSAASHGAEVVSYRGVGVDSGPRQIEVISTNADAVFCLDVREASTIAIGAGSAFRLLVVYSADAPVELVLDPSLELGDSPKVYLGGHAPVFTAPDLPALVTSLGEAWADRELAIDLRFHRPGPGTLHRLELANDTLAPLDQHALSGGVIPTGPITSWTPQLR